MKPNQSRCPPGTWGSGTVSDLGTTRLNSGSGQMCVEVVCGKVQVEDTGSGTPFRGWSHHACGNHKEEKEVWD